MTIVVGVSAPDGIILAADSRTTVMRPDHQGIEHPRIATDNAEKVFDVCGGYAVATFGVAFIGDQTIAGVMAEFEATVDGEANGEDGPLPVHTFADRLGNYFDDRYSTAREDAGDPIQSDEIGKLGFLIAGYDDVGVGHICEVLIPDGTRTETDLNTSDNTGLAFRGVTDVVYRLLRGVDWEAVARAEIALAEEVVEELAKITYHVNYPITVQDAVDLATFLVRTTIDMQRFSDGTSAVPGGWSYCGGPINVISVQQTGVDWVSRTQLEVRPRGGAAEGAL
ncbi:hypothetical protein [Baekduia sp. Peel2402]|uniref:hypothetical protein n=1 Tax=Baekduia sp. Peel2402 TaxID=3458296 RepID=UPI00403E5B0B